MFDRRDEEPCLIDREPIYPSALFGHDSDYFQFLENILNQTEKAADNENIAFYLPGKAMMDKKIFHDFLMETKRRFLIDSFNRFTDRLLDAHR